MAKQFTVDAREAVRLAQEEARRLGHRFIGTEHLVLGLAQHQRGAAGEALATQPTDVGSLRRALLQRTGSALDAAGLAAIGVDLDLVRRAAEANLGPGALDHPARRVRDGHLRLTKRARSVLALTRREADRRGDHRLATGHLLLALLHEGHGLGVVILRDTGADLDDLAAAVDRHLDESAA